MMKQYRMKKLLCLVGCIVLVAAAALMLTGCGEKKEAGASGKQVSFQVVVTDLDGQETTFDYSTDQELLGPFLMAEGLLEGDMDQYGLYIKSVNGIPLDWDTHGKYWAFYVDGEYALTGVDQAPITEGAVYSFKPES